MAADYSPPLGEAALAASVLSLPYTPETTVIEEIILNATASMANATRDALGAMQSNASTGAAGSSEELTAAMTCVFVGLAVAIISLGVLGNAFVVTVIFTDRKLLQSSVNLLLLNLALADLLNLLFCAPDVIMGILKLSWVLPPLLCPVMRFLQQYFLFASVLLQMAIGIERYMAICTPMQMQRFSRRTTVSVLVIAWMVAGVFASPEGFSFVFHSPSRSVCVPNKLDTVRGLIDAVNTAVLYCIPLVLLTVLYVIMCRRLWGKECMIAGESQQMAILRLRRSVVKMLVISMLIYFICYTPIQSTHFLHLKFRLSIRMSMNLLVLTSSAANPIVYIMCCRHFHQRFVAMVMGSMRCCCPRSPEKYQTVITENEKPSSVKGRQMSRSPYVSFRRSTRRPKSTLSVTLL